MSLLEGQRERDMNNLEAKGASRCAWHALFAVLASERDTSVLESLASLLASLYRVLCSMM